MTYLPRVLFVAVLLFATFAETKAQQPDTLQTEPCSRLYNQSNYEKAFELLKKTVVEKPEDYVTLRCLGLFLYQQEMYLPAILAFDKLTDEQMKSPEIISKYAYASLLTDKPVIASDFANKAMVLGVKTAEMYYVLCESDFQRSKYEEALSNCDKVITLDSTYEFAYLTKSMILLNLKRESESADYLEKFLELRPNDEDAEIWRTQISNLRNGVKKTLSQALRFQQETVNDSQDVFTVKEVNSKAILTTKPQTEYTEKARKAGHSGLVRIKAVLSSDGIVRYILIMKPLRFGLTTKAFNAVKRVQFTPAQKDGKTVSQYVTLEYNFRIY